jgi:hypothetical protein
MMFGMLAPRLITDNTYISVDNKAAIRQVVMNTLYSAACVNIYNENAKKVNANSNGDSYIVIWIQLRLKMTKL